jgi:hypothetical protein
VRLLSSVRSLSVPAVAAAGLATALGVQTIGLVRAHGAPLSEPRPQPAVAAILESLKVYRLVAIGETHRNQQVHDFIVTLLQDPRFLPSGGDIVVEFGNARYQVVMDRYTSGEAVASRELVHVWRDAVNSLVWDAPVYARFFATVRSVNQRRPPGSRLRVVLADPPIEWSNIHNRTEWEQVVATRDRHAADVIGREVLATGHRALLIFGSGHVQNEKAFDAYGKPNRIRSANLAELLQDVHPGATFVVVADWMTAELDRRLVEWRPPALVRLKGTWLGDTHVGPPSGTPRFEDIADAFLYLGPTTSLTTSVPSPEIYRDARYLRELIRRDSIQGGANSRELRRLSAKYLRAAGATSS